MNIYGKTPEIQSLINSRNTLEARYGKENGKKMKLRFTQLEAANNLKEICSNRIGRCHELSGNKKNQFAIDLRHPYRMIFVPAHNPIPRKKDGGIDLEKIIDICVISPSEDYH